MKRILATLLFSLMFFGLCAQKADLPNVTLKAFDGSSFDVSKFNNDGKPFIIAFWATWCPIDIKQFKAWTEVYDEWVETTGVKIFAVSIDNQRDIAKAKSLIIKNAWPFEFLFDENQKLYKSMIQQSSGAVPFMFLFNGDGKIVWSNSGYLDGYEEDVYKAILNCYLKKNTTNVLDVDVTNYKGENVILKNAVINGKISVVCFCGSKTSTKYLDSMKSIYNRIDKNKVSISVVTYRMEDITKNEKNPLLQLYTQRQWPFELFIHEGRQRSLELFVSTMPYTYLFDKNGKLIYHYPGYWDGREETIYKDILKLIK